MKRQILLILLIPSVLLAVAQASLRATIDPIEILIGDQATVTLTLHAPEDAKVEWPALQPRQMLVPGVEVIKTSRPGQSDEGGSSDEGSQTMTITLTSFDGNLYPLPPFKVKVNGKELQSEELALKVVEVEVDTTQLNKFFGPKDVQDNPFQWSDWAPAFWLSVLMLLLIGLTYWLYLRLRDNKPVIARIKIVKRLLPQQKAMQGGSCDVHTIIEVGKPDDVILEVAERFQCDAIVVGRPDRSRLDRMVMGSVSQKLVENSDCPVVIVPTPDEEE